MGKSYWFECSKCGYRAKVSGRADRGLTCDVQTIVCRDCKQLYDAVTRMRIPDDHSLQRLRWRLDSNRTARSRFTHNHQMSRPPDFQSVLNRLPYPGVARFKWVQFRLQCPVSPTHRVQPWNDPDKCPRCAIYLEKNAVPYRIWD